jgi:hypothetical protein
MSDYAYKYHNFKKEREETSPDTSQNRFLAWSQKNFYRTNYQSMWTNVNKNFALFIKYNMKNLPIFYKKSLSIIELHFFLKHISTTSLT